MHPKVEALRAAGDERPLRTIRHGSARNQAFQAEAAAQATSADAKLPKIANKEAGQTRVATA